MSELNNCDAEGVFGADISRNLNEAFYQGFSLSRNVRKVFPESVWINGEEYGILADFRNILRVFRMIQDFRICERHKRELVCRFFYAKNERGAALEINSGVKGFCGFVENAFENKGRNSSGRFNAGAEKRFDFEQDAHEIYQSFLFDYSIDLFDIPFLHFYRFCSLLRGLSPESPFMRKLSLRFMDLDGLKGAALSKALEAKASVALTDAMSPLEALEAQEFEKVWGVLL